MHVGDQWQYRQERREWLFEEDPQEPVTLGYRHFTVPGDTVISDESYLVVRRKIYDQDQRFKAADDCLVQVDSAGKVIYPEIEAGCSRFDLWIDFNGSLPPRMTNGETVFQNIEDGGEVDIGGTTYGADALALSASSDGHAAGWLLHYAANIGLYRWVYESPPEPYGPIDGYVLTYTLTYADVGDNVYGARVVSSDRLHAPGVDLDVSVFPNPIDDSVWLELVGPMGPGVIEMFDILGRRVRSRTAVISTNMVRMRVDTAELPPGPYFLRFTHHSGQITSRLVVKGRN